MRVPAFLVQNQRSIRLARCGTVPRLMIVAGPNGAGKSTLLYGIRSQAGHANIRYVGPHRAMRKQPVQQRHLIGRTLSFESVLSDSSVPSMEGLRIFDGGRDPWGYDEAALHLVCESAQANTII